MRKKNGGKPSLRRAAPPPQSDSDSDNVKEQDEEVSSDEEVFNLGGGNESSESESDSEQAGDSSEEESEVSADEEDSSDDEMDDSESGYPTGGGDIEQLVESLPPELRQRVVMGKTEDDDDEDESDDEDDNEEGWGKKANYWSGDTADLEIGQDQQDAEDEEEAALALRKEQVARRRESDYEEDLYYEDDGVDNTERPKKADALTGALDLVANGGSGSADVTVEKLKRDVAKLSKKQRMELLKAEAPEMLGLVDELNDRVKELHERINPIKGLIDEANKLKPVDDELALYLEVKQQLLLSYCTNTVFYLMLKAEGQSVRNHGVVKQLLHLRYAMEKMRPLDGKMKYQIDRLVSAANNEESLDSSSRTGDLRPNIDALLKASGDDDMSEDEIQKDSSSAKTGVYRAPKNQAVPYQDDRDEMQKEEKLKKKKKKLRNSEILDTLREEFGHAPEQSSSSGIASVSQVQKQLEEEAEERRKFEEDRFVRLTLSRKEKKSIKRREKLSQSHDMVGDIGDVREFEELADLASGISKDSQPDMTSPGKGSSSNGQEFMSRALEKAVSAFTSSGDNDKNKRKRNVHDDMEMFEKADRDSYSGLRSTDDWGDASDDGEDNEFDAMLANSSHKRRRAPEPSEQSDDDDDNLLENFSKKKKEFIQKKKEHYSAPARTGGREEVVESGSKRAATYEIMANRGLTPHRKKSNRNPRVKKREAFAKAVTARKGQVRDVVSGSTTAYGGELTGIKANLSRSRKIGN